MQIIFQRSKVQINRMGYRYPIDSSQQNICRTEATS